MEKKKIWISIDGGGTKTQFCVCDAYGRLLWEAAYESANYKTAAGSVEAMFRSAFGDLLKAADARREEVAGILLSAAGCDTLQDQRFFEQILLDAGFDRAVFYVCNDTEAVYYANCRGAGICAVAGTGSIACAFDEAGMVCRCGGWGAPMSDLGSGYWLGLKAIEEMLLWLDGVEKEDHAVYPLLRKRFEKKSEELAWTLSLLSVTEIASAARDVLACAQQGDPFCRGLRDAAAGKISDLIVSAAEKAGFSGRIRILTVGGLMQDAGFLRLVKEKTRSRLKCEAVFTAPGACPARDGLSYALLRFPA